MADEELQSPQNKQQQQQQQQQAEEKRLTDAEIMSRAPGDVKEKDVKAFITREMDLILDIPLEVSAELGRANMPVSEIIKLDEGSVIELSKLVGEPMEILINGLLTARGEVVVVNERFGVRVTDVIDPMEMVRMYEM